MEKFRAYRQIINDDDDWEFAVPWVQVNAALAAKDEEIEHYRATFVKIAEAVGIKTPLQLTAIAESDDETTADLLVKAVKSRLAEVLRALELRETRIAAAREAMIAGILSLADAIDNGFDASDLSHRLREMAAQAREGGNKE